MSYPASVIVIRPISRPIFLSGSFPKLLYYLHPCRRVQMKEGGGNDGEILGTCSPGGPGYACYLTVIPAKAGIQ